MVGPGFESCFSEWVRHPTHHASEPLVLQRGTIASTYHFYTSIDKLRHHIFVYTSSCRETELKTMLSSYFMMSHWE